MNDTGSDAGPPDEDASKKRLAELLIRICAVFGGLAYIPSAYLSWRERLWFVLGIDSLALLLVLFFALRTSLPYRLKVFSLLAISYGLGLALLVVTGPFGAGHLYLFCFVVLVGLFGNIRQLVTANLLCAATYAGFAVFAARAHPAWMQGAESVIVVSANAVMLGAVLSTAANYLVRVYATAAAAERRLRRLRETMLREIDHRVKNNLQMLSSLVSLRSRPGADPAEALSEIRESLSAIALVHQLLERNEARYSLKTSRFLDALFERFRSTYLGITFEYGWHGPEIEVDGDIGIDLGLMINEIVVNSVRHAFVDGKGGRVFLEASTETGIRKVSLIVGDDGGGSAGDSRSASDQMGQGRKIIDALARHLEAEMNVDTSRGFVYRFELVLPLPEFEGPEEPELPKALRQKE
jgi:two-component sensor histidine kinase